jgi:hypothetical protein
MLRVSSVPSVTRSSHLAVTLSMRDSHIVTSRATLHSLDLEVLVTVARKATHSSSQTALAGAINV